MFKKNILTILLSFFGVMGAIYFSNHSGNPPPPEPFSLGTPTESPFDKVVCGTGLVETNTRNINLGSFVSGIVDRVFVNEGDEIKKGMILVQLDDRDIEADIQYLKKQLNAMNVKMKGSEILYEDSKDQLQRIERLKPGFSVSVDQQQRLRFASKKAINDMIQTKADYESSQALLHKAQVEKTRRIIRSPLDGTVLKVRIRKGEYVNVNVTSSILLTVGNITPLHVRIQVDEDDLHRLDLKKKNKAKAFLKDKKDIFFDLELVRVEPLVIPKVSLSGSQQERVDTRVIEIIYKIKEKEQIFPQIYVGQQLDVYIETSH
jgi:multidrug efflux pump subunit AcrA (membrane-fusion protein)